ncbi:DUF4129 domain-containing protein [Croceicoccus sp. YJ47]|uniref:DUF4129 domain-containing protein n=1 Tax=Croceicoccus sp. YJ47 TaxID=2798724 RepID=UPI001F2176FB|nr:DUF4129 domain-containing protein [Croceicoccus sp. YJ47]
MASASGAPDPSMGDATFREAHRELVNGGEVQFSFGPATEPPTTPEWLRAVGRAIADALETIGTAIMWLFSWLPEAPYARVLLAVLLAALAILAVWIVAARIRSGAWRWPRRAGRDAGTEDDEGWIPAEEPARAWLNEADRLAADGRYGEAVHRLLLRSVEDMARWRPGAVRPSSTSRDLAGAPALPPAARGAFAQIAGLVERSLFGGRALSLSDWSRARDAYAGFALPSDDAR